MTMTMLARIKPYNPKLGQVVRRYMTRGRRYEEVRGWYGVSDDDAAYLKEISHDVPRIVHPVCIFDVVTKGKAAEIDALENRTDDLRAPADSPNIDEVSGSDLTTRDLKSGTVPTPESPTPTEPAAKKRGRPKKTT